MLEGEEGDAEDSLRLAAEALAIAEAARDRFSIAVAREAVGGTLRHMMRLEEAESHLDGAVDGFRELGARWELASASRRGASRDGCRRTDDAAHQLRGLPRARAEERSIITVRRARCAEHWSTCYTGGARGCSTRPTRSASAHHAATKGPLPAVEILLAEGEGCRAREGSLCLRYERDEALRRRRRRVGGSPRVFGPE